MNFVNPDGRTPETAWDILNVVYDVGAAVYNHVKKDHDKAREHWKNAAYDGLAVVVPGLPAGFSKIRYIDEAYEVVNGTIKGTEVAKVSSVSSKYSDVASPKNAGAGKRFYSKAKTRNIRGKYGSKWRSVKK